MRWRQMTGPEYTYNDYYTSPDPPHQPLYLSKMGPPSEG